MTRRIVLLLTVGAVMALMVALGGVASANHWTDPPCTFAGGTTTCVEVTPLPPLVTSQSCEFNQGGQRFGQQTVTQERALQTTTVYAGQSHNLAPGVSPNPSFAEINVGDPVLGPCQNVPGPR
jgi:hypothetical protein